MPEVPWTDIHNIAHEVVNKPSQRKARRQSGYLRSLYKQQKKRKERQGTEERYIRLNPEFKKIGRRDKKGFFSEECLIIEENNKRGRTRDLFRKIGNIKGGFLPKMGTIKDRNGRDLVDPEKTKKKWNEYTEELYKKDLNELNCYHDVVITQSQAFGSLKSSGP